MYHRDRASESNPMLRRGRSLAAGGSLILRTSHSKSVDKTDCCGSGMLHVYFDFDMGVGATQHVE